MTGRKRPTAATPDSSSGTTKKAKRLLAVSTFKKWQRNYDRASDADVVEVRRGHAEQGLYSCFVVFSLQRVQKQDLLDEELLSGVDNWFWESSG